MVIGVPGIWLGGHGVLSRVPGVAAACGLSIVLHVAMLMALLSVF